jgi:hypothetical protein
MRLCVTPILCVVLLSSVLGRADAASPGRITIHLSLTGAVTRQVTLSHSVSARSSSDNFGCRAVSAFGGPAILGISYNGLAWTHVNFHQVFSHPSFSLILDRYTPSQSRYTSLKHISLGLSLKGEGYAGPAGKNATATVVVQNGGRSGSFRVSHLIGGITRHLVSVTGTWRCDTLQ